MKKLKIVIFLGGFSLIPLFLFFLLFIVLIGGDVTSDSKKETGMGADIVEAALAEEKKENNGGEKFWSYMGFTERVEWCASFVGWCANECGYYDLEKEIIPKSALCEDFRTFYKRENKWMDGKAHGGSYVPQKGDFILFQWDGKPAEQVEHIGIVTESDGETVSTIEGNSSDKVRQKTYFLTDRVIIGYCIPDYPVSGNIGTGGHTTDETVYTQGELELIYACVQQEDGQSYEGALAVISTVINRVDSTEWSSCGKNALEQLKAPGQFCYSIDDNWKKWLGGNVSEHVKKAVDDCLKKGIRNHAYKSFRSKQGNHSGGQYIPQNGNYYFN